MKQSKSDLNLQQFFPENLQVQEIEIYDDVVYIHLRSTTTQISCPYCGQPMKYHHTVHHRTVQDLPIFGRQTILKMTVLDFDCNNPDCSCVTRTETFDGFLLPKSRMTERLAALVIELALSTSCESAARILQAMGIKICGDTVIRTLTQRFQRLAPPKSGSCIGVDDFALKKGHTYGTVIVDEETHTPLALLEGRDETALKKWLEQNKHVTTVTRDRANAYAKAIREALPDAMQIADRFHLYQNLMDTVKKVIKSELGAEISRQEVDNSKKNAI